MVGIMRANHLKNTSVNIIFTKAIAVVEWITDDIPASLDWLGGNWIEMCHFIEFRYACSQSHLDEAWDRGVFDFSPILTRNIIVLCSC